MIRQRIRRPLAAAAILALTLASCSNDAKSASDQIAPSAEMATGAGYAEAAAATEAAATAAAAAEVVDDAGVAGPMFQGDLAKQASSDQDAVVAETSSPTPGAVPTPNVRAALIKTAHMTVMVTPEQYDAATQQLAVLPGGVGGFVQTSSESGGQVGGSSGISLEDPNRSPRSLTLTMRVPSQKFDEVRTRIAKLGDVATQEISGEEVSAQMVDIEARLTSLRLQEDAYRKLFEKADKIADIITVQERLGDIRTQIEQITAQRASLQDRVAYSTIVVSVNERLKPFTATNEKNGLGARVSAAWRSGLKAVGGLFSGLVVAVVTIAPFIPLLVIGLFAFRFLARRAQRSNFLPKRPDVVPNVNPAPGMSPVAAAPATAPAHHVSPSPDSTVDMVSAGTGVGGTGTEA